MSAEVSPQDEAALIQAAQRGDVASFNELVLAYQALAYNVAFRLVGDADLAADVTQEAFFNAFRHIRALRGHTFRPWLLRIVTNACYDALRQRRREAALSLDDATDEAQAMPRAESVASEASTPLELAERSELRRLIARAVLSLPFEQRSVFVLADVHCLSYEEIAAVLDVPLGTVKSRLSRARAHLREVLLRHAELLPDV
ncbi:MAG: sigma-70 family RNA polymerase sigma factor [Thermoflexales bacterium]|nr:sigma-70 family RNA polymerase sigma factor [Thermoflexales bacterium]MCS7324786.1 sigma-70 family RNA polymerase sigma factor [Thermoflexales bacterium]MCX7938544.1 sigma-70 family RNA polymerase sigma factor [Thermoflexales bacterium]MDW8053110.1 sigma-70 family RNA polymerase sigma factor [Anaerolineae bacterium]MDW8291763.1 sigma-70 family RNA polymerase sigma factor [Anaerolineae bacterium]